MSNDNQRACACSTAPKLIFPCSGAADVGEIADRAARRLSKEGAGKMYCLAGVGGHIEDMLLNVQAAGRILAIDGCPKDCARQTLAHAGFTDVAHLRVTDAGFAKGASPATDERIDVVVAKARPLLEC
jgi:uncharacterized metal-binding protein